MKQENTNVKQENTNRKQENYKCEAGKLKLDVNVRSCTRCALLPLSDSFFDSDTELNRSKGGSMTNSKTTIATLWTSTNRT